jgi:phosphoribosylamine--glycine ligase
VTGLVLMWSAVLGWGPVKTLVIGSGGREHALALALSRDPKVSEVHVAPGNPGVEAFAFRHDIDQEDGIAIAALAIALAVDLVVIGPEAPLVEGAADRVRLAGIACFGPGKEAAQLEGSKAFAKEVMAAANVPTAAARVCTTEDEARAALNEFGPPYVVKDDALAAGKGVVVTYGFDEALAHAVACDRVVIEEFLDGPEVSLFAVTDGKTVIPLQPAQDFKRVNDYDTGPNTGGMGAYTPLPWAPDGLIDHVCETVLQPTVDEMAKRGTPFSGLLYAGLALTSKGLRVVEFNARFGDPETQPLLTLLNSSIYTLLHSAATGRLARTAKPKWKKGAAVGIVVAAENYPDKPTPGDVIEGIEDAEALDGVHVIQAGTARDQDGRLVTAGGRVLSVIGTGSTLSEARLAAYRGVEAIRIRGSHYRSDIALLAATDNIDTPTL